MQFMQSTKKKPTTSTQQQRLSLDFLVLIIPMTYHAIFCWTSKAQNYLQWKPWERYEKPLDSVNPREHVLFPTNKTFHNFWHLSTPGWIKIHHWRKEEKSNFLMTHLTDFFDSQNILSKMLFNISKIFNNTWYMTKTVEKS